MPKVMLPLAAQPLWLPTENLAAGPWEPVCAPVRLASAAASVSFASIPAQYVMFRLRCEIGADGGNLGPLLRFNNDSGATYDSENLSGSSTTIAGARTTGGTSVLLDASTFIGSGEFSSCDIYIAKPIAGAAGLVVASMMGQNSTVKVIETACIWANTADLINRIDMVASANNFAAGSIFYLEGSKF